MVMPHTKAVFTPRDRVRNDYIGERLEVENIVVYSTYMCRKPRHRAIETTTFHDRTGWKRIVSAAATPQLKKKVETARRRKIS